MTCNITILFECYQEKIIAQQVQPQISGSKFQIDKTLSVKVWTDKNVSGFNKASIATGNPKALSNVSKQSSVALNLNLQFFSLLKYR